MATYKAIQKGNMQICPQSNGNIPHVGGPNISSASDTYVENKLAVRVTDINACINGGVNGVVLGDSNVYVEGEQIATTASVTSHGGIFTESCDKIYIGTESHAKIHIGGNGNKTYIGKKVYFNCGGSGPSITQPRLTIT